MHILSVQAPGRYLHISRRPHGGAVVLRGGVRGEGCKIWFSRARPEDGRGCQNAVPYCGLPRSAPPPYDLSPRKSPAFLRRRRRRRCRSRFAQGKWASVCACAKRLLGELNLSSSFGFIALSLSLRSVAPHNRILHSSNDSPPTAAHHRSPTIAVRLGLQLYTWGGYRTRMVGTVTKVMIVSVSGSCGTLRGIFS